MQNHPNTNTEAPLDAEDWEIAFAVYQGRNKLALMLAQHLAALKEYILKNNLEEALAATERAISALYLHTDFSKVGHNLFRAAIQGGLTPAQEAMIAQLHAELK